MTIKTPGDARVWLFTGPSGRGKSVVMGLAMRLLPRRLVACVTTHKDPVLLHRSTRTLTEVKVTRGRHRVPVGYFHDKRGLVLFELVNVVQEERAEFLVSLAAACEARGNMALCVDEARRTIKDAPDEFNALGLAGRHAGLDLLISSQRYTHIKPDIRGNATRLAVFRTSDSEDLKRMGAEVGRRSLIPLMRSLPNYHFLWCNRDTDQVYLHSPVPF